MKKNQAEIWQYILKTVAAVAPRPGGPRGADLFMAQMSAVEELGFALVCQHLHMTPIAEKDMTFLPPGVECFDASCDMCGTVLRSGKPWLKT